jgi:acyl-CoA reductase-like NAD-dependent aldehyde dehydrogenase
MLLVAGIVAGQAHAGCVSSCVEGLTPVTLELGGKDAFVFCKDADLNQVRKDF